MLDYYKFKQVLDLCQDGKLTDAHKALKELQEKYIEVCDENSFLKTQVEEYEDILYLAKNLQFDGESYWLMTGAVRQGPFCRLCYNQSGLLFRLQEQEGKLACFTCGETYASVLPASGPEAEAPEAGAHDEAPVSPKVIRLYK